MNYTALFNFFKYSNMSPNTLEHKQYLIDSINEMNTFIDKCIDKLYTDRETISETSAKTIAGVIDRKRANVNLFKELLRTQYNHFIK